MSRAAIRLRWALLVLGLAMLAWGLYSGDYQSVMHKAVMLCYECMGIG